MLKPIKPKPHFYACIFQYLQQIAADNGYNLVVHGSMNRDLDLIAIPWVDNPIKEKELVKKFALYLRGVSYEDGTEERGYMHSKLPGGRNSYVINLNRGGVWNEFMIDEEYYLDISFTPLVK